MQQPGVDAEPSSVMPWPTGSFAVVVWSGPALALKGCPGSTCTTWLASSVAPTLSVASAITVHGPVVV